ncbi:CynX/NimT family MFS transporter [Stackebrandtia nassauensis]|uniref:Major facilitator superfamily MFS_1 n=1 Tax=Stackebrandtia nassauensis (strain DSM 44728 / CIP 108903 / NRRL B-16338 / NBRC 102104 / LLR-40K-21) TaxID=446470 RepID=D3QBD3_STANL|nr:MFS transporter [Stackebrandtia nassauensis]ADD42815.1 major facilitator superfamily MFS_1 [Stackebrandtia nassauensis DSM 44728]
MSASTSARTWLIATGVILAALNLRTAVTSVGPLLDLIQHDLGMSASVAGVLTTLPVLAFAVLGGLTPLLSRRFGPQSVLIAALAVMAAGLIVRAMVPSTTVFLVASAAALAGGAVGNVAIPGMVKLYFPDRIGAMTTVYTTSLALGTTVAAAIAVPLADGFGGHWQPALGLWAVPAVLAMVPWLLLRSPKATAEAPRPVQQPLPGLTRSRIAWLMLLAFGSQSLIAYSMFGWLPEMMRDHGYDASTAGFMLAIFNAVSVPISMVVPVIAGRLNSQRPVLAVLLAGYLLGFPGLWLGGVSAWTWISLLLVAVGMGTFPLMLTMFALRTRTAGGTAGLSAFAQSGGYLLSGLGPLLIGVLLEATGSWTAPFALLLTAVAVHAFAGWRIARPRFLEDELAAPEPTVARPVPANC